MTRASEAIRHVARGLLMGAADVVPGVSGGTVALLLGIYTRLIDTVRAGAGVLGALLRGRWRDAWHRLRSFEWGFALPLVVGIVVAVVALASVIDELLADEPEVMAGLFFGLVAASVVVALPLMVVLVIMTASFMKWLKEDYPAAGETRISVASSPPRRD